jgi:hypothetical protein
VRSSTTTPERVGLCWNCQHKRVVSTAKGSTFFLCGRSITEPGYAKYPALPVFRCAGYEGEVTGETPIGS